MLELLNIGTLLFTYFPSLHLSCTNLVSHYLTTPTFLLTLSGCIPATLLPVGENVVSLWRKSSCLLPLGQADEDTVQILFSSFLPYPWSDGSSGVKCFIYSSPAWTPCLQNLWRDTGSKQELLPLLGSVGSCLFFHYLRKHCSWCNFLGWCLYLRFPSSSLVSCPPELQSTTLTVIAVNLELW